MKNKINFEVAFVCVATLFLLLAANTSFAGNVDNGLHLTVHKPGTGSEALHAPSLYSSKVSSSRYYGNRYKSYRSNRKYYRGNRYYRGGKSYNRGNRYYGNRYYGKRYYGNPYRGRYGY